MDVVLDQHPGHVAQRRVGSAGHDVGVHRVRDRADSAPAPTATQQGVHFQPARKGAISAGLDIDRFGDPGGCNTIRPRSNP
jgi:hypothetical protein